MEQPSRSVWVRAGIIAAATLVAYAPAMRAGFVWDDDTFLTANPLIQAPDGLYRFWFTTEPPDYFPLTSSMLWLEWRLWGMHASGYHVVNVLLHIASAILLWRVLAALKIRGAFLAGLIFALHPVAVESVAWITERKNTLPMMLYLLAILLYLKSEQPPQRRLYGYALVVFLLALLAKTSVVMLPAVLLGCAWWRRGRIGRGDLLRIAPFFALAAAMGLVTVWFQYHRAIGEGAVRTDGFLSRLAIAGRAVWFYLYKALLPFNLSFVYPRWQADPWSAWAYLPLAALLALGWLCWRQSRRWGRPVVFALGYFVVTLLPVLGFLNIYFMRYALVADHWQYPALAGVIALAAGAARRLHALLQPRWRQAATAVGVCVLAGLGALTFRQARLYADAETLWQDVLKKNPDCWLALDHMGIIRARQAEQTPQPELRKARLDEAIASLHRALQIEPNQHEGHTLLANALLLLAQPDMGQVIAEYRRALSIRADYVDALTRLAWILATHPEARYRDGPEAVALAEKACRLTKSASLVPVTALAAAYAEAGRYDQAVATAEQAAALAERMRWTDAASIIRFQLERYYKYQIPYRDAQLAGGSP